MSFDISSNSPLIKINDDGTFIFKGNTFYLNIPSGQTLTPDQQKEMIRRIEQLLTPHLQNLDNLEGIKVETQGIHFRDKEVQYAPGQSEIFQEIKDIATKSLPSTKEKSKIPSLPKMGKEKKSTASTFSWPPDWLKKKIQQTAENFQHFAHHSHGEILSNTQLLFEECENELEKYETFDQAEIIQCLKWAKTFYETKLKTDPYVPTFFKNEFEQWLSQMELASSWRKVQSLVEMKIHEAYDAKVLDPLFGPSTSDQENQLGQIFLHLFQADTPEYLAQRLQSANQLYQGLIRKGTLSDPKVIDNLSTLLKELHALADPYIAYPLANRVRPPQTLPSYSSLEKIRDAVLLIFAAIAQLFTGPSSTLNAQATPDYLSADYHALDGELVGKEEAKRYPSVLELIASKEAQLENLLKQTPQPVDRIQSLQKEIERYKMHHHNQTWISSNQLRDDFSHYQKASKKGNGAINPEETYLPAIVNGRIHQLSTEEETVAIHRSGALSYMLDGSTNLMDLKDETMARWKKEIDAKSYEEFQQKAIQYLTNHQDDDLKLALGRIDKRQQALNDQMVQYIANQIKANITEIVDPNRFSVTRLTHTIQLTQISLLNPEKSSEHAGLTIDERNQMMDMAALFAQFNGKQVQFSNVSAPFLDGNTIHIPLSLLIDPQTKEPIANPDITTPFKLSCTFFNLSVQGLKTNSGDQKEINQYALKQLQENLKTLQTYLENHPGEEIELKYPLTTLHNRFKQLEDRLEEKESGYDLARDLALLQHDMQGILGVNCFSGKDRTGYLIVLIMDALLGLAIDKKEELSIEEKKALRAKWQRDLMNMDSGIASQIVN